MCKSNLCIQQLQKNLNSEQLQTFKEALREYQKSTDDRAFVSAVARLFLSTNNKALRLLFRGMYELIL